MDKVARLDHVQDRQESVETGDTNQHQVPIKEEDKEEVSLLVSNCEYFAEQLRIARSAEITTWTGGDFQNAHKWALYVKDQLSDVLKSGTSEDGVKMAVSIG